MKKTLLSLALSAVSASTLAADTITIAFAGPTTGPVTQYGTMQNVGAQMAVEQINAAGGMNGKLLEAKIYDDACEPKQAVIVANQIVNDGISFVIGHLCSSSTIPAAEIYDEEGIVMISGATTSPELSTKGFTTIFRTIGLDSQTTPVAAEYIANQVKPKAIAVLHDKQQYGQGLAEGVREELAKRGLEVAFYEGVNKGQTDFSALITKLKQENIDFIYWGGYHPEAGLILRQGADQDFTPKFMGADGIANEDLIAIAGESAEGALTTVPADFTTVAANADLVKAFKDKGEDASGAFVMTSYSALQVIADAANSIGSNDSIEVAEAIHNGTFNTPIGTISFQENGDLEAFNFVVYEMHSDGSRTLMSGETE